MNTACTTCKVGCLAAAAACLLLAGLAGGCAATHKQPRTSGNKQTSSTVAATPPASRPAAAAPDPKAELSLDQIDPYPVLPRPATRPGSSSADRPPLEALALYGQARRAMHEQQRYTAVALLRKAIELDPDSFDLQLALGQALVGGSGAADASQAVAAFERAAAQRPDDIGVRLQLGRQHLARGNLSAAIEQLRLALRTPGYQQDEESAATADLLLARALQQGGYSRAAVDQYRSLLGRLQRPGLAIRANPELAFLASRPETLYVQIAELQEKRRQWPGALEAYRQAAQREPGNLELQARIVQVLLAMDRSQEARQTAAELVTRFHASTDSLMLLREVYRRLGMEKAIIGELARLHRQKPQDTAITFALADVLAEQDKADEAQKLLEEAVVASRWDGQVVRRLFRFHESRNQVELAARLLVEAMAARPGSLREITPLWSELLRPSQKNRLHLSDLQKLQVSPDAQASKLFWVSRVAEMWNRDLLARSALEQAVKLGPPLPPAYRLLLSELWNRQDWDEQQKVQASQRLEEDARSRGDAALAAELRGLRLTNQKQYAPAIDAFAEAMKLGATSPDLQLTYAAALLEQGRDAAAEQMIWKLLSDWPQYEDAYGVLFRYYAQRGAISQAGKVLSTWLAADPNSVNAHLFQASIYLQLKRADLAERVVLNLWRDHADSADVLSLAEAVYTQSGRLDVFIAKLEDERQRHPENRQAIERLVRLYAAQKRLNEAARVLDAMRQAVADDPDLLYYVAHLYGTLDQPQATEDVLQDVIKLDPTHAPASNDLGYNWADAGKNLDRAEALIRVAVEAEPDNQSFLDSLGWVLYKRGKFQEAQQYLERALGPAAHPDPVVLDHMGDVLYRLGKQQDASRLWQRSMQRLEEVGGAEREDLKNLRLQLTGKLKQLEQKQSVQVAPVAADAEAPNTNPEQAKK